MTIDVINSPNQNIDINANPLQEVGIEQDVVINVLPAPVYEGEYEVTPSFELQQLQTKDKILTNNVTVDPISVNKVLNIGGGNTVIIGG